MAKNQLRLDTSGMDSLLMKLMRLEHETAKETVEASLKKVGQKVNDDTRNAVRKENLPAHGKYSHGDTARSVETDPEVLWEGMKASIPVGFNFNLPGAGGFLIAGRKPSLITGTPKMEPVRELRQMYRQKTYMSEIHRLLWDELFERISAAMEE